MSALDVNSLDFEEKNLHVPTLDEVQSVLSSPLSKNFREVTVEVVDCPDLSKSPYKLEASGLGGSPTLIEVGGPPYLLPSVDRTKIYAIKNIIQKLFDNKKNTILTIGAGAGPFLLRKTNCEGIFNIKFGSDGITRNGSYTAKVSGPDEKCELQQLPDSDSTGSLLLNLYACESKPGKVLRVHCKKRIGELNFIESIRTALLQHYKEKCVGMGGIFLLKNGNAKQHVMRDFSKTEIHTEEQLNNWLKFYEMPAQLNAVGTLVTHENDLDLRLQHFHSFSNSNWGGHYHYDTTPDTVEYEGYFNIAERVVRVDRPKITHKFGRD